MTAFMLLEAFFLDAFTEWYQTIMSGFAVFKQTTETAGWRYLLLLFEKQLSQNDMNR